MGACISTIGIDTQTTAMRRQFLDIENAKTVCREYGQDGSQRQIRIMLVIDRIELIFLYQLQQMRELESSDAGRIEQHREAGDEIVNVGHMGENVVGRHQIGAPASYREFAGQIDTEETFVDFNALGARRCRCAWVGSIP